MTPPIRLSPTRLYRWYALGCPAAWDYERRWTPVEPNPIFKLGTEVHKLLDGTLKPEEITHRSAYTIYLKLVELKSALGLTVCLDQNQKPLVEIKQEWRIAGTPEIEFVRKVDFIGTLPDGETVLVDWKTHLGYGWKMLLNESNELFAPQALGFQSPSYLIPPPQALLDLIGLSEWPTLILYLVGPARGPAQRFKFEWEQNAEDNFLFALHQAAAAASTGYFPKVYGRHCHDCEMAGPCFQAPGWSEAYQPYRPKRDELADLESDAP
jgi:hypothetical protein